MVHHSCPHCEAVLKAHGLRKKHQCVECGGFFSSLVNTVKKVASNPMVQQLAKAAAPHAMAALQKHAPGLAKHAQSAVALGQRVAANPMARQALSNPGQLLQQVRSNPGQLAQTAARALAPHAQNLAQRHAPGLTANVQRAVSLGQQAASNPMAQQGVAALRRGMGTHKGQKRKTARLAYEPESESDEEEKGMGRRRKAHPRYGKGGFNPMMAAQMAGPMLGMIPGASQALGPFGALLGGPQQQAPPPPPRASFQGIQGFQGPMMAQRPGVQGRGRRTRAPTAHSLAVKEVMKQTGMGLPAASKYVKEHGLAK